MKKFLLPIMLAFALLIPAIQAQATDVPNFKQVVGDSIGNGKRENEKGYCVYKYIVDSDDKHSNEFAEKYVNFLQENGITLIEHKKDCFEDRIDYWETHFIEKWFLVAEDTA